MDTKEFIQKAKLKHGNKYDYSRVEYTGARNKIIIICPVHGEFEQTPNAHLTGSSCKECNKYNGRQKIGIDKFIKRAQEIHGNKYDYSKAIYKGADVKLTIICPVHGEFEQTPSKHTNRGYGCRLCGVKKRIEASTMSQEDFFKRASKKHNKKYTYNSFISTNKTAKITCPIHGEFEQYANNHLAGKGCPKCAGNVSWTTEEAIKRAKEKHGNKYDYSKFEYKNANTKSIVICPYHGDFLTSPRIHINMGSGCPYCNESYGEKFIAKYLDEKGIEYKRQKRWSNCRDKNPLPFDFYIPSLNLAIEYDGEQHFVVKENWGGADEFEKIKRRDELKNKFCEENGIRLLRINYKEDVFQRMNTINIS